MLESAAQAILRQLGSEQRRVFADWRALILMRRATFQISPKKRRWSQLPSNVTDLNPLLKQMIRNGDIRPIDGRSKIFEVTAPFAEYFPVYESHVLLEINPYAIFSHMSAMVVHGLSDDVPQRMTLTLSRDGTGGLLPLGTSIEDWTSLALPAAPQVAQVKRSNVYWTTVMPARFFGFATYQPYGVPIRVTTPERTLLDGLQAPELAGGIEKVLSAWVRASYILDIDRLVSYVDRLGVAVLRQRVGFILDALNLHHSALENWRGKAARGGSSRLFAAAPYAPEFSADWNLSLNAPVQILSDVA